MIFDPRHKGFEQEWNDHKIDTKQNLAGIEYATAYYLDAAPEHSIVASAWHDPSNKETICFDISLKSSNEYLCPKVDSTRYVAFAPSLLATSN